MDVCHVLKVDTQYQQEVLGRLAVSTLRKHAVTLL